MAGLLTAPGFTAWDDVAHRNNVIPEAGSYGGANPHRFGRQLAIRGRGPMRAPGGMVSMSGLASFEEGIPFFAPLAAAESGYAGGAVIVPKQPCACTHTDNAVENAGGQYGLPHGFAGLGRFVQDVPGPAAAPGEPTLTDLNGLGYVYLGYDPRASGNLGQLPLGMDTQSLVWIAGIAGAGFLMWKMIGGGRKAKARALRKARASYQTEVSKIRKRYA